MHGFPWWFGAALHPATWLIVISLALLVLCLIVRAIWQASARARELDRMHTQAAHLKLMLWSDARWLASNPIAAALVERYTAAMADDWGRRVHEEPGTFRHRIGLDPHHGQEGSL